MPAALRDDAGDYVAEINVTPLVDVFLVLLLVFMVTAPLLTLGVDVDLPEVTTAAPKEPAAIVITIGPEGTIAVGERVVTLDEAIDVARGLPGTGASVDVYLRADAGVPYGFVMSVLDALRVAGIDTPSLLVEPLPDDETEDPRR